MFQIILCKYLYVYLYKRVLYASVSMQWFVDEDEDGMIVLQYAACVVSTKKVIVLILKHVELLV